MSATRLPDDDEDAIGMIVMQTMDDIAERVSKLSNAELEAEIKAMGIDLTDAAERAAMLFKDPEP